MCCFNKMYFHIKNTWYPLLFYSSPSPPWNKNYPTHANYFTLSFDLMVILERFCFLFVIQANLKKVPTPKYL